MLHTVDMLSAVCWRVLLLKFVCGGGMLQNTRKQQIVEV